MMLSTKSIPVKSIPVVPIPTVKTVSEAEKGCLNHTLSSTSEVQQFLKQAYKLEQQAQAKLKHAEQEAEKLYRQAKDDISRWEEESRAKGYEEGHRQGCEAGYQEGLQNGLDEGHQQYEVEFNRLKDHWLEVDQQIKQELDELAPQLVDLMIKAVKKLTFQQYAVQPEILETCLQEIITDLGQRERCVIQVSPNQVEKVEAYLPTLQALTPKSRFQIIPNDILTDADCRIETEYERIDIILDDQLNALKEAWTQAVRA